MLFLKQSTAVELKVGPFLDSTDGVTPETALTISQADVRLAKEAGDWAQKTESTSLVHEENGWYRCLLDATDTATLGKLKLAINESGALPVWDDFCVLAANVYDALVAASDKLQIDAVEHLGTAYATPTVAGVPEVDATHLGGVAQSLLDLKDFVDDGYDPSTNKVQGVVLTDTLTTYTGNTLQTGDSFARLGAPAGASVSADVAAMLLHLRGLVMAQGTIGSTGNDTTHVHLTGLSYADDELNDCLLVFRDVSADDYFARWIEDFVGFGSLATVALLPVVPQDAVDTYWLLPIRRDVTGGSGLDAAGVRAAVGLATANLDTQLGTLDTNVDAILVDTAEMQPKLPTNNIMGSSVKTDKDDEIDAIKVKSDQLVFTTANRVDATAVTVSDKTGYALSSAGVQAIWDALTAALTTVGSVGKRIADNLDATITSRLATAGYTVPPTAAANADAVWDEALAGHVGVGSTGEALGAAGSAGDPWVTALPGVYGAGSAGKIVGDNINATVSSRATPAQVNTEATDALNTYDPPTSAELVTEINSVQTDVAAVKTDSATILVDTNEIQTKLPTNKIMGSSTAADKDDEIDAIKTKTDQMVFTIANKLDSALNDAASFNQLAADKVWASASRTLTSMGTVVADVATAVWAAVSRTITGTVTVADKTGYSLSAAGVDAILDDPVDGVITVRESLRLANSANGGKSNGAPGGTFNLRDLADTKDRVAATVDADGNRTAIVRDLT